ncbi:MAG: L-aspartate oxidase [Bacteroidetes bacterium]|nr:L-aspartate oxidase [Bacteroidota bacterium]
MRTLDECVETDVLVIGTGIAGCIVALELADAGIHVTLVTRCSQPNESNTMYAQGGIIFTGPGDSPELLSEDIQNAGANICNPRAVTILSQEGPSLVQKLLIEKYGVPFDRTPTGELALTREGGHSVARIIHVSDMTGSAIENKLIDAVLNNTNITLYTETTAVDLLTPAHHAYNRLTVYDPPRCVGAYVLNQNTGLVHRILSRMTVLATGGIGQIYLRTTNPPSARGDGLAMAHRAGARTINCEYVQFHPTAFYQEHGPCFLITEALRGAGARLINQKGEPFMERYDPDWKDLAPRDVVARSIHQEMLFQNTPNVYLDAASYIPANTLKSQFPYIYSRCLEAGIDITQEPIPVVPAAHYFCGGVWVDEWGQSTIKNLYAIGEVSCTGLHGANRLASTSLLEGLVWGYRAAKHIQHTIHEIQPFPAEQIPPWEETGTTLPDSALIAQDMSVIKHIMWNYTGLIRTVDRLQRALRELLHLETEIQRFYRAVKLNDSIIGLRNAIRSAIIITTAAWANKKSIGCHYRA